MANLEDRLEECPEEYSTSYAQGEPDAHGPVVNKAHTHTKYQTADGVAAKLHASTSVSSSRGDLRYAAEQR